MSRKFVCVTSPGVIMTPDGQPFVCHRLAMFVQEKPVTMRGDRSYSILIGPSGEVMAPTGSVATYPRLVSISERHGLYQEHEVFTVILEKTTSPDTIYATCPHGRRVELPVGILREAAIDPVSSALAV